MANAEQLKALIRSYGDQENEEFYTIALQVAAYEASRGHKALAEDLVKLVDKARKKVTRNVKQIKSNSPNIDLFFDIENTDESLKDLILSSDNRDRLDQIIFEFHSRNQLSNYGLKPRRKLLFVGAPGTGKTMSARVLAHELDLNLYTVKAEQIVSKFMGETSAKLRQVFDYVQNNLGIYLFDEFDSLGSDRNNVNDVVEMHRVLSSFLQFLEQDKSDSIIIAATNNPNLLDIALCRRFDDILLYQNPSKFDAEVLMKKLLMRFVSSDIRWKEVVIYCKSLSHAEITAACYDALKDAVLRNNKIITEQTLTNALMRKQQDQKFFKGLVSNE